MNKEIIMYGADWCGDCVRSKKILAENNTEYTYLDIEDEKMGKEYSQIVIDLNNGKRSIPTFIIDDEQFTNPSVKELSTLLNLNKEVTINNITGVCNTDCQ
ncbi:MAG: thioredoxin reductase (NADPH) [Crocinitomicaceae bacterium]|jgi:thioredoxin reductase (NADPH)